MSRATCLFLALFRNVHVLSTEFPAWPTQSFDNGTSIDIDPLPAIELHDADSDQISASVVLRQRVSAFELVRHAKVRHAKVRHAKVRHVSIPIGVALFVWAHRFVGYPLYV